MENVQLREQKLADRVLRNVDTSQGPSACWPYTGFVDRHGYGSISVGGRGDRVIAAAHRVVYEAAHGPVPAGMDVGHRCHDADLDCPGGVCRHRRCCNPAHLEAQTRRENLRSGVRGRDRCHKGHALDGHNLYMTPEGKRSCRECRARRAREFRARKAAKK